MSMKKLLVSTVLGALVFAATAQNSLAALTADQRLTDFAQLVNILQRNYGPLRWKRESIGLDFNKLVEEYRGKVAEARNDSEFYRVLALFLSNLKDAHVSSMIPSTFRGQLGFNVDLIEGKVLIENIDTLRLPEPLFPFARGDQLIALGGVPVETLMNQLAQVGHTGHDASNMRIAAARLTSRRESSGLEVPRGVTTVTVLKKGAAQPVTVTATWIHSGTRIVDLDDLSSLVVTSDMGAVPTASSSVDFAAQLKKMPMFKMALPMAKREDFTQAGIADIGNPQSMFKLPANAVAIPGSPVTAAIYEAAGKKIGVLRINEYGEDSFLEVLARALIVMEQQTDVLVIDQTNNPGGSVSLVSDIVSLFADKSYKDMNFELRPSLSWLKSFQDINSQIADLIKADPNDLAGNALKARFDYLEGEIRESITGRRFLTPALSLNLTGSFGMIQPNPSVHYSKPVLLLINEFDFSGGDAFPALMKDNGRAVLFGSQTTGAGGNVREYGPLANSFFKLHLTESLMVRPNGQYVENMGIKPDIEYRVTEDDFNNEYRNYVKAFTVEALKLAGATQEQIDQYKAGTN